MIWKTFTLVLVLVMFVSPLDCFAKIYTCKSSSGKTIFTDNKNKCQDEVTEVQLHTVKDKRVNYRYPERSYIDLSSRYSIFVEMADSTADIEKMKSAASRLATTLDYIFKRIPGASHEYLTAVDFYIMVGPRSKQGGEPSGLRYFPKNGDSKLLLGDKKWTHSVVIYSVDNFMWLSDLWVKKSIMHELAHAWHYENWSANYPVLKKNWLASRHKGLYLSQKDINNRILEPAYASTNEKEYFSELSAIYFVGGNYYPFNRDELKAYDPLGFSMITEVWGD